MSHIRHRIAAPFPSNHVHRPRPSPPTAAAAPYFPLHNHPHQEIIGGLHLQYHPVVANLSPVYLPNTHNYNPSPRFYPTLVNHHHHQDQNRDIYFHHHSTHQEDETLILDFSDHNISGNNFMSPNSSGLSTHQEDETLILDLSDHNISGNNFTSRNSSGLSEETIVKNLRKRASKDQITDYEQEVCVVCQADFFGETDNAIATLRCGHDYHADCIKNWLLQKNECPICKATALVID